MFNKRTFFIAMGLISVPLLILWVLSYSKQNFNTLQYYGPKKPSETIASDTEYYQLPPFQFINQLGDTFTDKYFDDYMFVANFFYATCPDVCPLMNAKLATVYDRMKEFSEVKFLSITIDPENDTVDVLRKYASQFNADPAIWKFATATTTEIDAAVAGFLEPVLAGEDKTIHHSQQLILVDKNKHIRGVYDGLSDLDIKKLREEIKVLLYDYSEQRKRGTR
jgi:protein SCO1/2